MIDVFYQGEAFQNIQHLQFSQEASFGKLKAAILSEIGVSEELLLFIENEKEPVSDCTRLCDKATRKGLRVHVSRCRRVEVEVSYNGRTTSRKFAPAQTLARVKRWATQRAFEMTEEEAGEHALQIVGTHERPPLNIHVGSLANCTACSVGFDLVPDERINGFGGA